MKDYLGLAFFYTVFVILIPLVLKKNAMYLLPFLVVVAYTLTRSGNKHFKHLYYDEEDTNKNLVGVISTNLLNLIAFLGIFWQMSEKAVTITNNTVLLVIYGLVLLLLAFPIGKNGSKIVLKTTEDIVKDTKLESKQKLHNLVSGIVFVGLLIGCQFLFNKVMHDTIVISEQHNSRNINRRIRNKFSLTGLPMNSV